MEMLQRNTYAYASLQVVQVCLKYLERCVWRVVAAINCSTIQHASYVCKSSEICDDTLNMVLKFFFRPYRSDQVFLVVCSIYKRNS